MMITGDRWWSLVIDDDDDDDDDDGDDDDDDDDVDHDSDDDDNNDDDDDDDHDDDSNSTVCKNMMSVNIHTYIIYIYVQMISNDVIMALWHGLLDGMAPNKSRSMDVYGL